MPVGPILYSGLCWRVAGLWPRVPISADLKTMTADGVSLPYDAAGARDAEGWALSRASPGRAHAAAAGFDGVEIHRRQRPSDRAASAVAHRPCTDRHGGSPRIMPGCRCGDHASGDRGAGREPGQRGCRLRALPNTAARLIRRCRAAHVAESLNRLCPRPFALHRVASAMVPAAPRSTIERAAGDVALFRPTRQAPTTAGGFTGEAAEAGDCQQAADAIAFGRIFYLHPDSSCWPSARRGFSPTLGTTGRTSWRRGGGQGSTTPPMANWSGEEAQR